MREEGFMTHFVKYQAIYALAVSFIVSWALIGSRLEHLETNDIKQDVKIETNQLNSQDINTRLASIETSLEFIKLQLDR